MNPLIKPQPKGIKTDQPPVVDYVIHDLLDRKEFGIKKYGVYLTAFNGRNSLIDLYQELLDAAIYVRQKINEDWQEPYDFW